MKSKATSKPKAKEEIFWNVFESVIRLEVLKGHSNWKLTELSRASKVSRPLIYYYFGKSKDQILKTAVDYLGEEYFGLSEQRTQMWRNGKLLESVLHTRSLVQKAPFIHVFYTTRRHQENIIGENLRDFESRFRKKISEFFPDLTHEGNDAMAAILFGLVTFPDLTDNGVEKSIKMILNTLSFKS